MSDTQTNTIEALLRERFGDPRAMTGTLSVRAGRVCLIFGGVGEHQRLTLFVDGDQVEVANRKPPEAAGGDGATEAGVSPAAIPLAAVTPLSPGAAPDAAPINAAPAEVGGTTLVLGDGTGSALPPIGDGAELRQAEGTGVPMQAISQGETPPPPIPAPAAETGASGSGAPPSASPPSGEPARPIDYRDFNRQALAEMAERAGIAVPETATKAEIADLLNQQT